ncbi:hypothetical protein C9374_002481 [Naegleria lovaniensis]|uniref:Mitochondrial carrier protein n=1 Tax=Naegleria lovaniensis TaxID=51637 RepID=A0AA88GPZ1_NAELO|nr:uncharacterized protein C9374_002481 [Naegleria lovaniensis]KAG2386737.1 hypothetical protein C9374_002481 [Naegleria lovaniensis]
MQERPSSTSNTDTSNADDHHSNHHPDVTTTWNKLDKTKFYSIGVLASYGLRSIFFPISLIGAHQVANLQAHESMSTVAKRIYSQHGLRGFYRGYFSAATGKCIVQFTYLSSLEFINQYLLSKREKHEHDYFSQLSTFQRQALSGLLAEVISNFIVVPFDVVSQRLMISQVTHPNEHVKFSHVVREVWKMEGLRGLYRGTLPTLLTYGPESAIAWGTFSALKENISQLLVPYVGEKDFQIMVMSAVSSGAMTGVVTASIFHPFDIIRLRIQTGIALSGASSSGGSHKFGSSSIREVIVDLMKREGLRGFTKGISSKLMYNSGTMALAMTVYDILKWSSRSK